MKQAWIILTEKIISFHLVENAELFEAAEREFWRYVVSLVNVGYRIQ